MTLRHSNPKDIKCEPALQKLTTEISAQAVMELVKVNLMALGASRVKGRAKRSESATLMTSTNQKNRR